MRRSSTRPAPVPNTAAGVEAATASASWPVAAVPERIDGVDTIQS
jgi:hypothetical protein